MATIDDPRIIAEIIAKNGKVYDDEPPVIKIVEYINAWGNKTWGVVWASEPPSMHNRYEIETEYVQNPKIIFART